MDDGVHAFGGTDHGINVAKVPLDKLKFGIFVEIVDGSIAIQKKIKHPDFISQFEQPLD